jgi:D-arabinose 1-dehydrogenase-like Zn-dependent alcohol dehydrogenase
MKSFKIADYGQPLQEMDDPAPQPAGREVLVRVTGCGVCHSDVHIWEGYFDLGGGQKAPVSRGHTLPFTLGHEIVGTVEAMGPEAEGCQVGDAAVVYPWIGCGECDMCKAGNEPSCPRPRNLGVHKDGGYATHVLVPDCRYLYAYGDTPGELAATYACSGITAYGALKKVKDKVAGRHLLIVGAGGVGLAGLLIARAMTDATIIVADIDDAKLEAAKAAGADHVVNPTAEDARKEIIKLTGGGAAGAVDFVGSDKSAGFAVGALGVGGHLVVVGLMGGAMALSVPLLPLKQLTLQGSYVGTPQEMRELMDLVAAGKVAPLPVATRPLAQADQTLRDLADGKIVGRVVLTP